MKRRVAALGLLLSMVGCAAMPNVRPRQYASMPANSVRFPSDTWQDIVYTVARFNPGHKREFEIDLIRRRGIIPVHLSVALRGEGQSSAKILLNSERLDMRMYLPDGTALRQVRGGQVASTLRDKEAGRVHHKQFRGDEGLLSTTPTRGYVFFELSPRGEFDVDGTTLTRTKDGIVKELDLTRSLITFNVMIDDTPKPVFVGIKN